MVQARGESLKLRDGPLGHRTFSTRDAALLKVYAVSNHPCYVQDARAKFAH